VTVSFKAPGVVLDELGITEPSEIVIEAIAEYCHATIVYEPLDGCAARILGGDDRAIITVDANSSRERQRFSAGHELGHWMRDRGKVAFSCTERELERHWVDDHPERRANRYAADLLLPRKLFAARARSMVPTFECARELASMFTTSLTATAIRLVELGPAPAMVLATEVTGRKWFAASDVVPRDLWPRAQPGTNTVAAKLLDGRLLKSPKPVDVDADDWIEHRDASRYTLKEDSIVVYGGLVLTLLWWNDESQILALQGDDEPVAELSGELTFNKR
jgi:hypothetical protein